MNQTNILSDCEISEKALIKMAIPYFGLFDSEDLDGNLADFDEWLDDKENWYFFPRYLIPMSFKSLECQQNCY